MSIFRRKARIRSVVSTTVNTTDGSELENKLSGDEMINVLEKKLPDLEERYKYDKTAGPQLAKRYATLGALYKNTGNTDKQKELREKALKVIKSDSYPDDEEAREIEKLVRLLSV